MILTFVKSRPRDAPRDVASKSGVCLSPTALFEKKVLMSEGEEAEEDLHRNLPGTKVAKMWNWTARPFAEYDGPLALAEYIQDLIRSKPSDIEGIYDLPSEKVDVLLWQYEHLRQFVLEFNLLLVALAGECTVETCPKMTASNEWQYLCAAHRKPQDCAAIDYITHTIDGSTALLTARPSPSEVSSAKHFQSMSRRLYRIFAHVYFHHRGTFDRVESQSRLCARFQHFVMRYQLMSRSMLLVPQESID